MQLSGKRYWTLGMEGSGLGLNLLYSAAWVVWVYTMYIHSRNHPQAC
jgi:hypothetical protein